MRVPGRSVQQVGTLTVVTISRKEWQAFLAEYDRGEPATRYTTPTIFYGETNRYARSTTPAEVEPKTRYEEIRNVVLHMGDRRKLIMERPERSYAMDTGYHPRLVVRVE
ncbi:hypothetical protein FHS43_003642 [Streptosporangium becharense]|uniref:Uncharacterized protein n=1 Tax=Streptosporangium becharense TaxID=1816182 RepID=A0A7W9MH57_9ACTN|nr:hypothetical protein [Streptosporangium becharense]MBB2912359.1 hypothetical protein [Streptosporangium becharense]MBB5820812.1 hypothetical protein [Streptosporangium becharense]